MPTFIRSYGFEKAWLGSYMRQWARYEDHLQYLKNKKTQCISALGIAYGFLLSHLLPPPGAV
jgi:hypothetical protein